METKETKSKEAGFINPFDSGVSLSNFISALKGQSVGEYLDGKFKPDGDKFTSKDVAWIESELAAHESHVKNRESNLKRANAEHAILQDHNLTDKEKEEILKKV